MHTNCEPLLTTVLRVLLAFFHLFDSFNGLRYAPTGYVWACLDRLDNQAWILLVSRTRSVPHARSAVPSVQGTLCY